MRFLYHLYVFSQNVTLVTMVMPLLIVHCVLAKPSSRHQVMHLTVTQRHRVMVSPMRRMLDIQPVVSNCSFLIEFFTGPMHHRNSIPPSLLGLLLFFEEEPPE